MKLSIPRLVCLFIAASSLVRAGTADFASWPSGTSPTEIGRRLAEHFVVGPHSNFNRPGLPKSLTYPEDCTWYGALTFARLAGDSDLTNRLIRRFEPLLTPAEAHFVPKPVNVDASVFGIVPLQIYIENKDPRCLAMGLDKADRQWADPQPDGLTNQTRYWIDDMFMITSLQIQAYRATGDTKYLDRTAREMVAYLDKLQQPNGLFFHAPESPYYWGRGNGWVAAGMSEVLRELPATHPDRPRILAGYKAMMAALLRYQDDHGMWHQLIDRADAWPETSCTGMFAFAFISGVKNGWLDSPTYGPAARKAWLGLVTYITPEADVREVCEGTNKNPNLDYYLKRKRNTGDLHGQAPVLWCASALLR